MGFLGIFGSNFQIFGSSLGKIFRILGYLGQDFGDFWVGFGIYGSRLGWE
jgi:hypothetical protein